MVDTALAWAKLVETALVWAEVVDTALASTEMVVADALVNVEVKMTFTLKVTLLVGDVTTRSKYLVPTSFSLVERTCS